MTCLVNKGGWAVRVFSAVRLIRGHSSAEREREIFK